MASGATSQLPRWRTLPADLVFHLSLFFTLPETVVLPRLARWWHASAFVVARSCDAVVLTPRLVDFLSQETAALAALARHHAVGAGYTSDEMALLGLLAPPGVSVDLRTRAPATSAVGVCQRLRGAGSYRLVDFVGIARLLFCACDNWGHRHWKEGWPSSSGYCAISGRDRVVNLLACLPLSEVCIPARDPATGLPHTREGLAAAYHLVHLLGRFVRGEHYSPEPFGDTGTPSSTPYPEPSVAEAVFRTFPIRMAQLTRLRIHDDYSAGNAWPPCSRQYQELVGLGVASHLYPALTSLHLSLPHERIEDVDPNSHHMSAFLGCPLRHLELEGVSLTVKFLEHALSSTARFASAWHHLHSLRLSKCILAEPLEGIEGRTTEEALCDQVDSWHLRPQLVHAELPETWVLQLGRNQRVDAKQLRSKVTRWLSSEGKGEEKETKRLKVA